MSHSPSGNSPNRLIEEKSPYLLQHAHNPVDWYPWGEEAFDLARKEARPIFLSIGYSTCHWCHVMERESFENHEIAALMNEHFVCIKVDREERPDVDKVYMTTVQALTGSGGWPLSVWLTPELVPFYGGTYFPPDSRYGRPGFPDVLRRISQAWQDERQKVVDSGEQIVANLRSALTSQPPPSDAPMDQILRRGYSQFYSSYDVQLGGFGQAPKFPRPVVLSFLLRYHLRSGEKSALEMVLNTLRQMWAGGMYDHLGGGFHRYSVDAYWRVPHFEKMLYDQAQLVWVYLEAYQLTGDSTFAQVAAEVLDYVLRDLTHAEGGFYSAEDADSAPDPAHPQEKEEGAFYLWEKSEIVELLGDREAEIFNLVYGVSEAGNTISDPQGELGTRNVLHLASSPAQAAQALGKRDGSLGEAGLREGEVEESLRRSRSRLVEARSHRSRPHLDDKIITSWNGLMISAFARGYQVLGEAKYLEAAERAASFVLAKNYDAQSSTLKRRYREGEAKYPAHLDDYAFLTLGLLDLYETSLEVRWLQHAVDLTETQNRIFGDEADGGFFDTSGDDKSILLRTKDSYDGAEPSGNSIAVSNLLRLAQMLDRGDFQQRAEGALRWISGRLEREPHTMPHMLVAAELGLAKGQQVIIAGPRSAAGTRRMIEAVHRRFLPHRVLLLADGGEGQAYLAQAVPFLRSLAPQGEGATAYVCEGFTCELPTDDVATLVRLLKKGDDGEA